MCLQGRMGFSLWRVPRINHDLPNNPMDPYGLGCDSQNSLGPSLPGWNGRSLGTGQDAGAVRKGLLGEKMKIEIKHRISGIVLFSIEAESWKIAVEEAVKSGANLRSANLSSADLRSADLSYANLSSANLSSANLSSANLIKISPDTRIETGETWKEYLNEVVPSLLKIAGNIVKPDAWECHEWTNCPMAQAFAVDDLSKIPTLYRPRAEQFIRYFDAKLIPMPDCVKDAK